MTIAHRREKTYTHPLYELQERANRLEREIIECKMGDTEAILEKLHERKAELVKARDHLASLVTDAQAILADYLPPDGISKDEAIDRLLTLLDGPRSRVALSPSTTGETNG